MNPLEINLIKKKHFHMCLYNKNAVRVKIYNK